MFWNLSLSKIRAEFCIYFTNKAQYVEVGLIRKGKNDIIVKQI